MSISIAALTPNQKQQLLQIELTQEQIKYTATATAFLQSAGLHQHLYSINRGPNLLGYFMLDTDFAANFDLDKANVIGLRSFAIDRRFQGQGIGTAATEAIVQYVCQHYPQFAELVLTVNLKNIGAQRCYSKAGFTDTGALYLGGQAGPQAIYSIRLGKDKSWCLFLQK